jgi:cytochrome b561
VFARLTPHLPHKRTVLKALHYSVLPLFIWFTLVQPQDVRSIGNWAFQVHSVFGLIFVSLALFWTGLYLRKGLIGRPGPKLPPWARVVHQTLHKVLIWGIFLVAFTGFLLGLTSSVLLWAGGIVPIAPPLGLPEWNRIVGIVHSVEFYTLGVIVAGHAGFHIWRHLWLRDNALRIMAPKRLHRYL